MSVFKDREEVKDYFKLLNIRARVDFIHEVNANWEGDKMIFTVARPQYHFIRNMLATKAPFGVLIDIRVLPWWAHRFGGAKILFVEEGVKTWI